MASHGLYNGHNSEGKAIRSCLSLHFKYSFESSSIHEGWKSYPGTYQGIGVAVNSFFHHQITGTPVSLYLFQGMRLAELTSDLCVGYEWNLGLSTGWKRNEAVGSRNNIYINVGIPFTFRPAREWEFTFGPEYTHFSNGDTYYPNGGANTVGFRLGVSRIYNPAETTSAGRLLFSREDELEGIAARDRMTYDIMTYGAWRAKRTLSNTYLCIINEPFIIAGISFNPLYTCNRYLSIGPSLDVTYDSSANIRITSFDKDSRTVKEWSRPSIWRQTATGISLRGELATSYFAINLGIGYNILKSGKDMKGLYTVYNLKVRMSDLIYFNIGYRLSSLNYTHNLMFGLGFRV